MRIVNDRFENLTTRRGLYCVWVPAGDDKKMSLVARWFESEPCKDGAPEAETSANEKEAGATCSGTNSLAA